MRAISFSLLVAIALASSSFTRAAVDDAATSLRGTAVVIEAGGDEISAPEVPDENAIETEQTSKAAASWYKVSEGVGQSPWNVKDLGGNKFSMTVRPDEEACKLTSNAWFTGGKFAFRVKTAAVMPGIITAVYLASGDGRTGDGSTGQQDELDYEWKGNSPSAVQVNVFMNGQEDNRLIDLGGIDSSQNPRLYTIEWTDRFVGFYIDSKMVHSKYLARPLKPMQLSVSVWTTMGGWEGLKKWGGETNWWANGRNGKPATAEFEIVSFPSQQ